MAKRYRADQVGSLLRPKEVLDAHTAYSEGKTTLEAVRQIEDKAILEALEMQRQVGIDVLTDGEFRRSSWAGDFQDAVEGYVPGNPSVSVAMQGNPPGAAPNAGMGQNPFRRVIGEKLRQKHRLTEAESGFLKEHAQGHPYKVTMPAATYVVARAYNPEVTGKAYPTRVDVLNDAGRIIKAEIQALMDEGVPYIQLDNPHYPDYVVEDRRAQWRAIGIDPEQALREDIAADNACLAGFDRTKVTLAMHLCRGNGGRGLGAPAGWHTSGGYDAIAEQLFGP